MSSFKVFCATFSASLAVHAFFGYSLIFPWHAERPPENDLIQIDDVRHETVASPSVTSPKLQEKNVLAVPPGVRSAARPERHRSFSHFQKMMDEKIKKQLKRLKRSETPAERSPGVSSAVTSAELLNDPAKSKIFLSYYSGVKKKIESAVHEKGGHEQGRGNVYLEFVLDAAGQIERLRVVPKGTKADEAMQELAVKFLRESAPFDDFPKDLGSKSIAFSLTIFFDGTD